MNKENKELELRMYGLVPYNISPIQQAIQFGHGVVEYGQRYRSEEYDNWANNYKTFIILDGGTTNWRISDEDGKMIGTLNQHLETLIKNDIKYSAFSEPDLGDQLTAIVFIVDERVFNRKDYPDFEDWVSTNIDYKEVEDISTYHDVIHDMKESKSAIYLSWVDFVGGEKNVFLRDFLKGFKKA